MSKHAPTWLLLLLAVLIVANLYTIAGVSSTPAQLSFPPIVRILLAIVWIGLFMFAEMGLVRGWETAFTGVAPLLTLYAVIGLLWNTVFERSSYSRGSQGFDVLVTIVVLAPVWWIVLRRGWLKIPTRGTG